MYRSVVVPLDGSSFSERAVAFAARLGAAGADVVLVRAVLEPMVVTNASAARIAAARQEAAVAEAEQDLAAIAEKTRAQGTAVTTRVEPRYPPTAIRETTDEGGADLIVMATHSRAAPLRAVLGSVAEEVLRTSHVPMLLIPPSCEKPWPVTGPLRVLVALDGSPIAEQVLVPALELADALDADLDLVRVVDDEAPTAHDVAEQYLRQLVESLRGRAPRLRLQVLTGNPADRILELARREPAHVIAMATHGRSGLGRILMGSVTTAMLQRADIPLLVVGPTRIGLSADA
jgi:nucleotide-binding universal stress UspA family protein